MKASELRIGNLVDLGNRIAKITEIYPLACMVADLEQTQDTLESYERVTGIPLTEAWLLKFGFSAKGDKGKLRVVLSGKLGYVNGRTYYNSWAILESQPKYVHQLQNLYFALTGEELTIKE